MNTSRTISAKQDVFLRSNRTGSGSTRKETKKRYQLQNRLTGLRSRCKMPRPCRWSNARIISAVQSVNPPLSYQQLQKQYRTLTTYLSRTTPSSLERSPLDLGAKRVHLEDYSEEDGDSKNLRKNDNHWQGTLPPAKKSMTRKSFSRV